MTSKTTAPVKRSMQTTFEVSKLVRDHYAKIKEDKTQGKPVVWCFGLMPREIWIALDVATITVEHLPIMLAAKQVIGQYLDMSEELGYSRDLCAYHTAMLGCSLGGVKDEFTEKLFAPPDVIIASNYPCISESKSFLPIAQKYECPYYFLDAPLNVNGVDQRSMDYYAEQLKGMLAFLEEQGLKLDMNKLRETMAISRDMTALWTEIDEYRKLRPTPMGAADSIVNHYMMIMYPGHPRALEMLRRLKEEVRDRAERGIGVIDEERFRLLFVGIPPWFNLSLLSYPEGYGGVIVKTEMEYLGSGLMDINVLDPERPLETLAKKLLIDWPNPTYTNRIDMVKRIVRDFSIDGIIANNKRGCRNQPAGLRFIKDAAQDVGVPMTIFDLDGLDLREYNDAQAKANIDSFMETIAQQR